MQPGPSTQWRDIAEKHHAALLDEMQRFFDASLQAAATEAAATVRAETDKLLAEAGAEFERSRAEIVEHARTEMESALAVLQEANDRQRKEEVDKLRAEAQSSLSEVRAAFERDREADLAKARKSTAQSLAEYWNQTLRRLRQASSPEAAVQILAESAARHADHIAVLVFEGTEAHVAASKNVDGAASFPVAEASAIQSVIETRDPVVTLASEGELSAPLHNMLQPAVGERAYLFPVRGRQAVVAVLAAHGRVEAAPLEFLCEAAGLQFDVQSGGGVMQAAPSEPEEPPVSSADLIQIAGIAASPAVSPAKSGKKQWDELDGPERQLHLQAQRFARVQAAEMRLYQAEAVRAGIANRRLYAALQAEIDEARKQYLRRFLSASPNMVDYLHLEILRSLANDDDGLLGDDYPGPMV